MRNIFILLILFAQIVFARAPIGFADLEKKPSSRAKDFATLLFLRSKEGNATQNKLLFYSLRSPKPTHFLAFGEPFGDRNLNKLISCRNTETAKLINESAACLAITINAARAENIKAGDRKKIADRIKKIDPAKAAILYAVSAQNPFEQSADDLNTFFAVTLSTSDGFFTGKSHLALSKKAIQKTQGDARFSMLLERSSRLDKKSKLLLSLSTADENATDSKGAFYLGIINVLIGDKNKALNSFVSAEKKAWSRYGKDRAIFWKYLIEKDEAHLKSLLDSSDINIYTLYARELLKAPMPSVLAAAPASKDLEAIYNDDNFNDPFFWTEIMNLIAANDKNALRSELKKMGDKNAEPFRATIDFALSDPAAAPHYYLNPFPNLIEKLSIEEQALTLAIMRKESRFISSAISTSYAIGAMQMMPFLIESMTKERGEKADFWSFFNPDRQMPFAIKHIKWLMGKFDNPLFIAYAYNGGYGFTSRAIERHKLFAQGEFEPFLSLELMPVEEPREYGKSVLANYIIYRHLLGKPITPQQLLQTQ